jgi:transcriptional regulator with XRE-family HTH domain
MNRLRLTRFRAGMTISTLAAKAGVSRNQITRLEEGAKPQAPTALALAQALGVDVADLWPGELLSPPQDQEPAA